MGEIWKSVVGWEGYEVSSLGRVRSVDRSVVRSDGTSQTFRGKLLRPRLNKAGYWLVRLSNDAVGKRKMARLHRLVAEAFLPNPDGKSEVNHIDCDRANPQLSNLEWVTSSENKRHGVLHGKVRLPRRYGESANSAKLTYALVAEMRAAHASGSAMRSLARQHKVDAKTVRDAIKMVTWKAPAPPAPAQDPRP